MYSKPCKYAIRAILFLGKEASDEKKLGVQRTADSLNIPRHYLAKILQRLSKHRMISSIKGPKGGFFLTDKNLDNSILDIIECMDGSHALTSCILGLQECSNVDPCPMHEQTISWRSKIIQELSGTTIRQAVENLTENRYNI